MLAIAVGGGRLSRAQQRTTGAGLVALAAAGGRLGDGHCECGFGVGEL